MSQKRSSESIKEQLADLQKVREAVEEYCVDDFASQVVNIQEWGSLNHEPETIRLGS